MRKQILVVDDYPEHRKLLRWHLAEAGFEVAEAATLAEAREALVGLESVSAIIVDGKLPDGDGLELVAAVGSDPQGQGTPIFVLSGRAREEDRARALSSGAAAYFTKPVDYDTLITTIAARIGLPR